MAYSNAECGLSIGHDTGKSFRTIVGEGTCDLVCAQFAVENKRVTQGKVNRIRVHGYLTLGCQSFVH